MSTLNSATSSTTTSGQSVGDAVVIEHVTVTFGEGATENTVLDDLSLTVPQGQFIGLVGRSGQGKTTVLNLLAGLVKPTAGSVSVLGVMPREARVRSGYMFARDALLPWRNASRNVEYGLEIRGFSRAERRARSARWLEAVHLGDSGHLWPWQLSQGMRQRVALARTWALDPELLLMDEPFAALDAQTRISVQDEFLNLWQDGPSRRTVVFVTHDLAEAVALADRVVLVGDKGIQHDTLIPLERPRNVATLGNDIEFRDLLAGIRSQL